MADATRLRELLHDFDTAVLMTHSAENPERLRGRPMRIAGVDDDGTLWFFTSRDSGKVQEALAITEGYCVAQTAKAQVVLRGRMSIVDDPAKMEWLWNKALEVWWPEGTKDPALCLIRFVTDEGEYWDATGTKGLRFLMEAAKAFLSGDRIEVDADMHGHVYSPVARPASTR